ncbi:MAG TPA: hypothetical protein VEL31_07745 [Ktedonobacteraceae bacterium]|nr:hypothetical protein [Ktedonobacteraceae bacterium]
MPDEKKPDDKKPKDKASKEETEQTSAEGTPASAATEGGRGTEASLSPRTGQVTLSKAQVERLRRKLREKYH